MGTRGLPIPLSVPPSTSLIPQMKYVLDIIIIFCLEYAITAGDDDIMAESCPEKIDESKPKVAPKAVVIKTALTSVFFTRFMFPAPIFCDTYGVVASEGA